jgi:hypothetical protein
MITYRSSLMKSRTHANLALTSRHVRTPGALSPAAGEARRPPREMRVPAVGDLEVERPYTSWKPLGGTQHQADDPTAASSSEIAAAWNRSGSDFGSRRSWASQVGSTMYSVAFCL